MHTLIALLVACGPTEDGTEPPDTGTTSTATGTDTAPFASLLAQDIPEGVLLSAWSNGDEAWMVGGDFDASTGHLVRWRGDHLCVESDLADGVLWWIHGRSPDDWYAVGERGIVVRGQGDTRTREDLPTEATLFGVYDDGTDVWAVGGDVFGTGLGEVWVKRADSDWSLLEGDLPNLAFKVWDGWVVGAGYTRRIEGDALVDVPLPGGERLTTVRGHSANEAWAVGGTSSAQMVRYVDAQWQPVDVDPTCAPRDLMGVWTESGSPVYVSGSSGTAARLDGDTWTCAPLPLTNDAFHAVWKHNDTVLFVGGNLTDSIGPYHGTLAALGDHAPLDVRLTCDDGTAGSQ